MDKGGRGGTTLNHKMWIKTVFFFNPSLMADGFKNMAIMSMQQKSIEKLTQQCYLELNRKFKSYRTCTDMGNNGARAERIFFGNSMAWETKWEHAQFIVLTFMFISITLMMRYAL